MIPTGLTLQFHDPETGNLKIYANGEVVVDHEVKEANNSNPLDFRFSTFFAGDETLSLQV